MDEGKSIAMLFERLERSGIPFMVGGSLASSAHGNPRQTNDVDIVLNISAGSTEAFLREFGEDFSVTRRSIEQALEDTDEYRSFQMTHFDSLLRVDCFVPVGTEFQGSEFSRRQLTEVLPGLFVPVATAEDIILRKLDWFRLGGRVSDRQWNDIVAVLEVQKGLLDETYLDKWAARLGLTELLDEARSQTVD